MQAEPPLVITMITAMIGRITCCGVRMTGRIEQRKAGWVAIVGNLVSQSQLNREAAARVLLDLNAEAALRYTGIKLGKGSEDVLSPLRYADQPALSSGRSAGESVQAMKTARLWSITASIECPYCGESRVSETGDAFDVIDLIAGEEWDCYSCNKSFKIPRYLPAIDLKGTPTR